LNTKFADKLSHPRTNFIMTYGRMWATHNVLVALFSIAAI